jgi:hypothetical protein
MSTSDLDLLLFDIKLKEVVSGKYIVVNLRLNGVNKHGISFNNGNNGFDDSNLSYQTISIDKAAFNAPVLEFDEIVVFLFATGFSGYYLDNVRMFKGSGAETVPQTGIQDAPVDGDLYGRRNASWEAVVKVQSKSFVYDGLDNTFVTDTEIIDLLDVQIENGANYNNYATVANGNEVTIDTDVVYTGNRVKLIYNTKQ